MNTLRNALTAATLSAGVTLIAIGVKSDNTLVIIFGAISLGIFVGIVNGRIDRASARH